MCVCVCVYSIADYLLHNLYRWLSWPGSALYDPALHRALQSVMAKLFAQVRTHTHTHTHT